MKCTSKLNPPETLHLHKEFPKGATVDLLHGYSPALSSAQRGDLPAAVQLMAGGNAPPALILAQPHRAVIWEGDAASAVRQGPQRGFDGAWHACDTAVLLAVKTADCVPLLAWDPELRAIAALHAGWRGVALGILPNLLRRWRQLGSSLNSLQLSLGPSIQACCFEVKADCLSHFQAEWLDGAVDLRQGSTWLNLEQVLRAQAAEAGLHAGQLQSLGLCTRCYQDASGAFPFASYRRSRAAGQQDFGTNVSFIGYSGVA